MVTALLGCVQDVPAVDLVDLVELATASQVAKLPPEGSVNF